MTNGDRIRSMTDEELADSRIIKSKGVFGRVWIAIDLPYMVFLSRKEAIKAEIDWLKELYTGGEET